MNIRKRFVMSGAVLGAAVIAIGTPSGAQAAGSGTPVPVSATALSGAAVVATPLVFGSYSSVATNPTTANSLVTVTATPGTTYDVSIDKGAGAGASVGARKLTNGSNTLTYSVYRDAGFTQVWGDTAGNTVSGTGNGLPQVLTAYGQIPAGQYAAAGAYTDTLTVTVTY